MIVKRVNSPIRYNVSFAGKTCVKKTSVPTPRASRARDVKTLTVTHAWTRCYFVSFVSAAPSVTKIFFPATDAEMMSVS